MDTMFQFSIIPFINRSYLLHVGAVVVSILLIETREDWTRFYFYFTHTLRINSLVLCLGEIH